ncbi:Uncharacterized protein Fot_10372 [Forsythia ovata]|uniref:Uncharacterized protein n=1 Tax=Forsythia ovata TaxID=205694 RepID=A0ABD1WGW5_9LAMI
MEQLKSVHGIRECLSQLKIRQLSQSLLLQAKFQIEELLGMLPNINVLGFVLKRKEFMPMNDDDRYEDVFRKKELKNKSRRELYAQSQREEIMQPPQSDYNSILLVDERKMSRNTRRKELNARKKEH